MSPAQQPPRQGCAQCPLGTQGSGQSLGGAGHGETQTEELTCVAAAVSLPARCLLQEEGEVGNLCAAGRRPPLVHLTPARQAQTPCTSSFSRRGPFVSSELRATPSSLLDSKPPRACSTSWRQLHICRGAGRQWREREEANVGGTHQGSRPTWL